MTQQNPIPLPDRTLVEQITAQHRVFAFTLYCGDGGSEDVMGRILAMFRCGSVICHPIEKEVQIFVDGAKIVGFNVGRSKADDPGNQP